LSRLRSAPGAKSAARSSAGGAARGVYVQSPKSDIFVVLLGVAFGAMLLGCLLLILVWNRYGFSTKAVANLTPPAAIAGVTTPTFGKIPTVRL